jgi:hypothetical protein
MLVAVLRKTKRLSVAYGVSDLIDEIPNVRGELTESADIQDQNKKLERKYPKKTTSHIFPRKYQNSDVLPEPSIECLDRFYFRKVLIGLLTTKKPEFPDLDEDDSKFSVKIMDRNINYTRAIVLLREILNALETSKDPLQVDRLRSFTFLAGYLKSALDSFDAKRSTLEESLKVAEMSYLLKMACHKLMQNDEYSKIKALSKAASKSETILELTYTLLKPSQIKKFMITELAKPSLNQSRLEKLARDVLIHIQTQNDHHSAVQVISALGKSRPFILNLQRTKKNAGVNGVVNFWSLVDSLTNSYLMMLKTEADTYLVLTD